MWLFYKLLLYPLTKLEKAFKVEIDLDKEPFCYDNQKLLWELEQNREQSTM